MRLAFLIPAITALGLAGCQVPPPVTTAPATTPIAAPPATPVSTPVPTPVSADTGNASEAVADSAVDTDTDTQTSLDESAARPPASPPASIPNATAADMASSVMENPVVDEIASTAQEPVAETIVLDDGGEDTTATAEIDEPATAEIDEPAAAMSSLAPVAQVTREAGAEAMAPADEIADEVAAAMTELALAAPTPPPPPPPPELAPQSLIGLDKSGLKSRLGDADFKRREGPVETWQYRFPSCVVDYFIHADDARPAVRNWAWRAPVIGGNLDAAACRRALAGRDRAS